MASENAGERGKETVVDSLSREEEDQLQRSTKKPKVTEVSPMDVATNNSTPRRLLSYAEVCGGVNGGDDIGFNSDDELLSEDDMSMDEETSSEEESDEEEEDGRSKQKVSKEDIILDDILCPTVRLTSEERRSLCKPWRQSLIINLLGKKVGYRFLRAKLMQLWRPKGGMEFIDMANNHFLVRFSDPRDYHYAFEEGPWLIGDHYLVVQRWRPEFSAGENIPKKIAVWIRVPKLPIEYYDQHVLWRIGNKLGKTIKVDRNTLKQRDLTQKDALVTERGKFARICIEVDLNKILISKFRLHIKFYAVEYEGLHMVCFHCGKYGHRMGTCPLH